jgi:hypothetical protein
MVSITKSEESWQNLPLEGRIHLILLDAPQHVECLTSGGINVEILSIRITKPTSTMLLNVMDSPYNVHMTMHFAYWASLFQDMTISLLILTHLETLLMFLEMVVFPWMLYFIVMSGRCFLGANFCQLAIFWPFAKENIRQFGEKINYFFIINMIN